MPPKAHVIGIAGPVGAGKSTLAEGLARLLGDATVLQFDHYERVTEQPIEQVRKWMEAGAEIDEIDVPGLGEAVAALKSGQAVVDPATGRRLDPARYILFETQFGRRHAASGRQIDLLVWVDTPLDLALARKVRQFAAGAAASGPDDAQSFAPWLHGYLGNYLDAVGDLLRMQKASVGAGADVLVDGQRDPAALQQEVARVVRERLP